eukprot:COSAG06_NODE_1341_length_9798_cov_3.432931_8_plen_173_part_00
MGAKILPFIGCPGPAKRRLEFLLAPRGSAPCEGAACAPLFAPRTRASGQPIPKSGTATPSGRAPRRRACPLWAASLHWYWIVKRLRTQGRVAEAALQPLQLAGGSCCSWAGSAACAAVQFSSGGADGGVHPRRALAHGGARLSHQPRSRMEKSTVGVHLPDLHLSATWSPPP